MPLRRTGGTRPRPIPVTGPRGGAQAVEERARPRVDRRLLGGGAAVGGLLLGLLLLTTVFGGKDDGGDVLTVAARPVTTTTLAALAPPEASTGPATSDTRSRDPFLPVVTVPASSSSAGAGPAPTGATQAAASSGPAAGTAYASLELKSTFVDDAGIAGAEITVDGQSYRPALGETFSFGYRLERVEGGCVEVSAPSARAEMCLAAAQP